MQVYVRVRDAAHEYEWRRGTVLRRLERDSSNAAAQQSNADSDAKGSVAAIVAVQLDDGSVVEADEAQDVLAANTLPEGCVSLAHIENLDALTHLHEASFVDYLQHRYVVDEVYCKAGAVLIAVNPFKTIPGLYDMHAYRARIASRSGDVASADQQAHSEPSSTSVLLTATTALPPHVFSIAESAFRSLQQTGNTTKRDQTILVSGESGAGKTETTKFVMNYLADVSTRADAVAASTFESDAAMSSSQLLSANPILESFGNAQTLRNDNSSRFGKFVRMFFVAAAHSSSQAFKLAMVGTSVDTYLLESVRVVRQTPGERNFHVFYELLAGADASLRHSLELGNLASHDFAYLCSSGATTQDAAQFARVVPSLDVLGFSAAEQTALWTAVAALLHLGNVAFIPSTDDDDDCSASAAAPCRLAPTSQSHRSPAEHLASVATLLGVERDAFLAALTTRKIAISGECFLVNLSQAQCSDARDAMARTLYSALFQFLVAKINANAPAVRRPSATVSASSPSPSQLQCIAVLDIFGFEAFDVNAFEQLCINYANEKLQSEFVDDILAREQQLHVDEGIAWHAVTYSDNAQCLELLELRPTGLFALLDEECIIPKGSDHGFARKLYLQHQHHAHFSATRTEQADAAFTVHHYAGAVQYSTRGFCDTNKDQPNNEVFALLEASCNAQLATLFRAFVDAAQQRDAQTPPKLRRRSSAISAVGIASQFKQQLAALIDVVRQTQTHYIRCIKPNDVSRCDAFDAAKVALQLRYGGVLKAVEIMRQSFPVRMPHAEFAAHYSVLMRPRQQLQTSSNSSSPDGHETGETSSRDSVAALIAQLQLPSERVQVGKTRVFLRQQAFDALELQREQLRQCCANAIQRRWQTRAMQRRYQQQRAVVCSVQLRWRAVRERKQRKRRRDCAVQVLQCAARRWLARQQLVRLHAATLLQRVVRMWLTQQRAARRAMQLRATREATAATASVVKQTVESNEKSVVSRLASLKPPPAVDATERGSMASYSVETSSFSEDPVDELLELLHSRSASNASLPFEEDARAPENLMLRQALEALERLRDRAEAAEAALAQIAGSSSASIPPGGNNSRVAQRQRLRDTNAGLAMDVNGNTALHLAVATGDAELALAELMRYDTDDAQRAAMLAHAEHERGQTPLHVAVRSGSVDVVGLFFRPDVLPLVNLDSSDRDGNASLHLAAQLTFARADRVMELLLSFGANANATNNLQQTPLHLVAMVKRSGSDGVELLAKLLRYGADPQSLDFRKRTPLHYCVDKGMEDEAVLLMRHGADPNVPDADGVRVVAHSTATNLLRYLTATPSWIPETDVLACMVCVEPFAFFSRKHHCDRCGRVCCSDCSSASSSWHGRFCFDCRHYQHAT